MNTAAFALLFAACLVSLAVGKDYGNCTEVGGAGSFACYTCYDLDGGSCDWGISCCKGSCWKLIDEDTSTVAKGCTNSKQSSTSGDFNAGMSIGDDELSGAAYFCDGEDYCNSAFAALPSLAALLLPALAAVLRQ